MMSGAQLIFVGIALLSFLFGLFIQQNPSKIFEIQKKFYRLINWHIEPIDFNKEMRNTRLMGLFLMGFVVLACLYYFLNQS